MSTVVTPTAKIDGNILLPKYNAIQKNALTPVAGAVIYNTSSKVPEIYDGSVWKSFSDLV